MKRALLLITILLLTLIFSCTSTDDLYLKSELEKAVVTGRIIDEEGLPLEGVRITLNNNITTKTDINGHFLYFKLLFGTHTITIEKSGYTSEELTFDYKFKFKRFKKPVFLKAKLFSYNYLLREAYESLKEKRYEKVEEAFAKLEEINTDDESYLYIKAIYLYVKGEFEQSEAIVENLKYRDRENVYYQLTMIELLKRQEKYKEMAEVMIYLGKNHKDYVEFIKDAADIYREKLQDVEGFKNAMTIYTNFKK